MKINQSSDNFVYLNGPVNVSDGSAVSTTPVSCTARVFDDRLEMRTGMLVTKLMADYGANATKIVVPKPSIGIYRDTPTVGTANYIRVYDADGISYDRIITGITEPTEGYTLSFSGAFGKAISAGARVELRNIAAGGTWVPFDEYPLMADYGKIKSPLAGYEFLVLGDQAGLDFDQVVEVSFSHLGEPVTDHQRLWAIGTQSATTLHFGNNRRVRVQLGADIPMTPYGTFPTSNAIPGDTSWGFRGLLEDVNAGPAGVDCQVEVVYDGGAGLKLRTAIRAKIESDLT